jgi:hypothetical protein
VLQRLGVARNLDMDDEAERRQVDAPRRHVGRHADPGAPVAQRLKRLIAFVLECSPDSATTAKPRSMQVACRWRTLVARRAEQDRRFRLVKAQQVDHAFSISDGETVIA